LFEGTVAENLVRRISFLCWLVT